MGALLGIARSTDVFAHSHCHLYSIDNQCLEHIFQHNRDAVATMMGTMESYADDSELQAAAARIGATREC